MSPRVVADEAQHVKNLASQIARQLRTVPSAMRLALTGTPVENNRATRSRSERVDEGKESRDRFQMVA